MKELRIQKENLNKITRRYRRLRRNVFQLAAITEMGSIYHNFFEYWEAAKSLRSEYNTHILVTISMSSEDGITGSTTLAHSLHEGKEARQYVANLLRYEAEFQEGVYPVTEQTEKRRKKLEALEDDIQSDVVKWWGRLKRRAGWLAYWFFVMMAWMRADIKSIREAAERYQNEYGDD